jgi:hypothetical protein
VDDLKKKYCLYLESNFLCKKRFLRKYWSEKLRIPGCDTGLKSIITEEEFKDYVEIFVDYDMDFKRFPKNHPNFPGMPMARTIKNYFDYDAKVHGFTTYKEFAKWKYEFGPWKPRATLFYFDSPALPGEKEKNIAKERLNNL